MSTTHDWFFDFISPYAYLQWMRMRRDHPQIRLNPRPLLFAGLLKHWGQIGPAELPGKRKHTYRLVTWQAQELGIPLRFPPAHPFNPLPALRLALAAADRTQAVDLIFRHLWEQGRQGDSAASLEPLAHQLGIGDLAAALANDEVKRALAGNGQEAVALGIFGVPTLKIGSELFWGNDATAMALRYLDHPGLFDEPSMRHADNLPVGIERSGIRP